MSNLTKEKMAENIHNKYENFFGLSLVKCDTLHDNNFERYETIDVLKPEPNVIGVYFSVVNVSEEFTKSLLAFYERLNDTCRGGGKKIEIIQICISNALTTGDSAQVIKNSLAGLPWFAVPLESTEQIKRLMRRFNVKVGIPTLIILDRECGTITALGHDRVLEDPDGIHFPWQPRPANQILRDVKLLKGGFWDISHDTINYTDDTDVSYANFGDDVVIGFYFSANWCPPCRAFTPQLVNTYQQIRKRGHNFEIIFVSSDRSEDSFGAYTETMPWLAVPYEHEDARRELASLFSVQGIPTLVLLDSNGHIITDDGRAEVVDDPEGLNFPWKPKSLNILTERYATKMHDYPAIVLFIEGEDTELQFAESVLKPIAENYYRDHNISLRSDNADDHANCDDNKHCLQFLVGVDSDTSDILREFVGLEDAIPLLAALNIPERKYAYLDYGLEINSESVKEFVDRFLNGTLKMKDIKLRDQLPESSN